MCVGLPILHPDRQEGVDELADRTLVLLRCGGLEAGELFAIVLDHPLQGFLRRLAALHPGVVCPGAELAFSQKELDVGVHQLIVEAERLAVGGDRGGLADDLEGIDDVDPVVELLHGKQDVHGELACAALGVPGALPKPILF